MAAEPGPRQRRRGAPPDDHVGDRGPHKPLGGEQNARDVAWATHGSGHEARRYPRRGGPQFGFDVGHRRNAAVTSDRGRLMDDPQPGVEHP